MKGSVFKAAIIGGVILFVWYAISWMVIPWNNLYMKSFTHQERVAQVIKDNAPEHAVYVIGCCENQDDSMPFVMATVIPGGNKMYNPVKFIVAIVTQIVGAFLVAWMVSKTKGLDYFNRVKFITIAGLFLALLSTVPDWNWAGFPLSGTIIMLVSTVIGWFLAGLAMGKVITTK